MEATRVKVYSSSCFITCCQLSRIMRESHACGLKTSIPCIEDNFSILPDSQIQMSCSKKTSFHFRFAMYYFFALYNNRKSFQMSTIRLNHKCSKVVGVSSDIFGNVRKSSEIFGSGSDVFGNPDHDETKFSPF